MTVTLEEDLSKFDAQMTKGATLTLRGKQAEYFVRSRRDVGDGTNVSRMRRQQAFIRAAEGLFIQGIRDKMDYAGTVYDALSGHMTASSDRGWLINKAYECRDYRRLDTKHLAGSHSISADGFMEFHPDKDALDALLTANFFEWLKRTDHPA